MGRRDRMVVAFFNCLCNQWQCISPLTLRVRTTLRRCVLNTTLCDIVCQWLTAGDFLSVSSTNKTDHHDLTEILLKELLNIITQARIQGGGLKLEKIWFFWRKIVIFHTKYPKNFAPPSARRNFFKCTPP